MGHQSAPRTFKLTHSGHWWSPGPAGSVPFTLCGSLTSKQEIANRHLERRLSALVCSAFVSPILLFSNTGAPPPGSGGSRRRRGLSLPRGRYSTTSSPPSEARPLTQRPTLLKGRLVSGDFLEWLWLPGGSLGFQTDSYGASSEEAKYEFNYKVKDDEGNDFGHEERRDGDYTQGSYYNELPDGRRQVVTYEVNGDSGFVADVKYSGEAHYDSGSYESRSRESSSSPGSPHHHHRAIAARVFAIIAFPQLINNQIHTLYY
ncbi:Pro-resilin [Portunus trituberculatus]|uniref:Pro-resilin n=1 Tax=Portunus trituberculatus TaxID=210409 RepID=A0A5B7EC03_PORTR|nr:Pro-resilin [Portunus trituberculatus]